MYRVVPQGASFFSRRMIDPETSKYRTLDIITSKYMYESRHGINIQKSFTAPKTEFGGELLCPVQSQNFLAPFFDVSRPTTLAIHD